MSARRLLPALALLVGGCGTTPPRLYYETTSMEHPQLKASDRPNYLRGAKDRLGKRRVQVGGKTVKRAALDGQPLAVLYALYATAGAEYRGAEVDLLVREKGKRSTPVSLRIDVKGRPAVTVGKRLPKRAAAPTVKAIRSKYGTGPFTERGAKWGARERRAVTAALELLPSRERRLLVKLPFVRSPGKKRGGLGAEHHVENCREHISVYDRAFRGPEVRFVGAPTAPRPAHALTILHELGHALHTRPGRLLTCQAQSLHGRLKKKVSAFNADVTRLNRSGGRDAKLAAKVKRGRAEVEEMTSEYKRLTKRAERDVSAGPVLAAFSKAVGTERPPTRYGESSVAEAFAEAYALHHADRGALERVAPKAARWFAKGAHLAALGEPVQ